eukprot:1161757-Pelagomonas_calceolata.AAC.3
MARRAAIEDERMFSALTYLKSPQRSSLRGRTSMCMLEVARCRDSVDETGYKRTLVKCNVLSGFATWELDMIWVLGL